MGSFAGNCAVSNLPISSGDKVLWVYAKPDYVTTTYELADIVWRYAEKVKEVEEFKRKNAEFAQKFPGESPMWDSFWTNPPEKEYESGFGEYDDYGWVEDEDTSDEHEPRRFMVRKDVADKMAEFGRNLIAREWMEKKPYLVDNYLYCFLLVCKLTRIHLFGHVLLGRQCPDSAEMKEQAFVHKIIGEELRALTKEIKTSEQEYKDWSRKVTRKKSK